MKRFFVIFFQPADGRSKEKACSADWYVHPVCWLDVVPTDSGVALVPVPGWLSLEQPTRIATNTAERKQPDFVIGSNLMQRAVFLSLPIPDW